MFLGPDAGAVSVRRTVTAARKPSAADVAYWHLAAAGRAARDVCLPLDRKAKQPKLSTMPLYKRSATQIN